MFGSTLPEDEFRSLLKEKLGYSEESGSVENDDQALNVGQLLGVSADTVKDWARGLARPTPPEERRAIIVLRALKTFERHDEDQS